MREGKAPTVAAYLKELPPERRKVMTTMRRLIKSNLPRGYRERLASGYVLCYEIPLARYPNTYNHQPLWYAGLAAMKNSYSIYLMAVYSDPKKAAALKREFEKAGKKLDMGKSCVRFRSLDDLPLDAIGKAIASTPVDEYIERYERRRKKR